MPTASLPESATVVAGQSVLSSQFDEELVILNLDDGVYYGLDHVGARIWELTKKPITVGALRDTILAEYDVERARCEHDLTTLLRSLSAKGLVRIELA
jgi:hypothetical protein